MDTNPRMMFSSKSCLKVSMFALENSVEKTTNVIANDDVMFKGYMMNGRQPKKKKFNDPWTRHCLIFFCVGCGKL